MTAVPAYDRMAEWCYQSLRAAVIPTLRNSQYAYRDALTRLLSGHGRWLDVGCGHQHLPVWMREQNRRLDLTRWQTVGIDPDRSALRCHESLDVKVCGGGHSLPFADASFDLVTANMVLEHVETPAELFAEVHRVLQPGGTLLVHTPNAGGYTTRLTNVIPSRLLKPLASVLLKRKAEDVYPTYYRANSESALRALALASGLDIQSFDYVQSSPQFVRVPPLMAAEVLWLRTLEQRNMASMRPCIVAEFRK